MEERRRALINERWERLKQRLPPQRTGKLDWWLHFDSSSREASGKSCTKVVIVE